MSHTEPLKTGDKVVILRRNYGTTLVSAPMTIARETKTMLMIGEGRFESRFYKKNRRGVGDGGPFYVAPEIVHVDSDEAKLATLRWETGLARAAAEKAAQDLRTIEKIVSARDAINAYSALLEKLNTTLGKA